MSERSPTRSPEAHKEIEWSRLLEESLTAPGSRGNTYNRFYNYSFLNQMLLFSQGVNEPVATYKKWVELGRQVQKGSKAKAILRPVAYKEKNELGVEESKVKGFKMVNCLFTLSETEGDEIPEYEPKAWSAERALGALAINRVQFQLLNGNAAGYSIGRDVAVSPIAPYPLKTLVHEIAHVDLGHTSPEQLSEYQAHRGIKEFQAESTAYLALNELDALDAMNPSESRAYIQGWLHNERPDDKSIRQVFTSVDNILKAGRSDAVIHSNDENRIDN